MAIHVYKMFRSMSSVTMTMQETWINKILGKLDLEITKHLKQKIQQGVNIYYKNASKTEHSSM